MQAVIQAGGDEPTPLLDIGGKPFLVYVLENLRRFVNPGCRLYATYLIADTPSQNSFRYSRAMVEDFGTKAGWIVNYIGEWGHPENQMMVEYLAR